MPPVSKKENSEAATKKTQSQEEDQPPGAESLLPQQAKTDGDKKLLPSSNKTGDVDNFLPPTAKKSGPAGEESDSSQLTDALGESGIAESEKVILPDGDGGFVEVSERKTTVNYRGATIELDSMKREEKDASRSLKNFIVITFCFVLLVVLMVIMGIYFGPEEKP